MKGFEKKNNNNVAHIWDTIVVYKIYKIIFQDIAIMFMIEYTNRKQSTVSNNFFFTFVWKYGYMLILPETELLF